MLHKHANQRLPRHISLYQRNNRSTFVFGKHARTKTGSVEAVRAPNAPARLLVALRRGVHGEISALRMAADVQRLRQTVRDGFQVPQRARLRGHAIHVGHIEIFAPPRKRAVRAAKPHKGEFVLIRERKRGKLRVVLLVEHARAFAHMHIAKPRTRRQSKHEVFDFMGNKADEHLVVILGKKRIFEPKAALERENRSQACRGNAAERLLLPHRRQNLLHTHHAELGKHKRIDRAKRHLFECGELGRQVIHDGFHTRPFRIDSLPTRTSARKRLPTKEDRSTWQDGSSAKMAAKGFALTCKPVTSTRHHLPIQKARRTRRRAD